MRGTSLLVSLSGSSYGLRMCCAVTQSDRRETPLNGASHLISKSFFFRYSFFLFFFSSSVVPFFLSFFSSLFLYFTFFHFSIVFSFSPFHCFLFFFPFFCSPFCPPFSRTTSRSHNFPFEQKFKILGYALNRRRKSHDAIEERMQSANKAFWKIFGYTANTFREK